jgi:O-antigen ligase
MMIPVIILQFFFNRTQVLLELGEDDATNMVNNVAYTFVRLMPFVFLIKKKKILSFLLMLLMCIFVVQGAKRGAMISAGLILVVYYYFQMRTVERRNRFFGYILALAGVVVLSFFVYRYFMENEYLIRRMVSISNGDTSGRTVLYSRIWEGWSGSHNLLNLLFGYGFAASIYLTGLNEAHNDWLELLSNFGLLGVTTYLYLFYSAVKSMLNPTWLPEKKILMFTVVLVWFFISLISMWYVSLSGYTQAILLAYLVGSQENSLD